MRHQKRKKTLDRGSNHRSALLKNAASSFFLHGKIKTTQAKANFYKSYIENCITIGRTDTLHSRRELIKKTGSRAIAQKILKVICPVFKDRKGGYTRIIKLGFRKGDGSAEVLLMLNKK
ncbi:MAG: 50S ribosomal protein L17 [Patescibacteria group bacterium]|nr:50S ribosomal protein L17 [Patescibacteria group bacterium]MDD5715073.1 50S ribosomal protein L17 [Patescibacteria group bacterium]